MKRVATHKLSGGWSTAAIPAKACRPGCLSLVCFLLLLPSGCSQESESDLERARSVAASLEPALQNQESVLPVVEFSELLALALDNASQEFKVTLTRVERMKSLSEHFREEPTDLTLTELKESWVAAHSSFESTSIGRQLLKGRSTELRIEQLEYLINAWPIFPGYVDYIAGYPGSGLVNDFTLPLNTEVLRDQHGKFDLAEATLGFHVIEYLLWGENRDSQLPRPLRDFIDGAIVPAAQSEEETGAIVPESSEARRLSMLSLLVELLLSDLQKLEQVWTEGMGSLRADLSASSADTAMAFLLDSTATLLSEEIIVRSLYPLLNGDFRESLQSPYSHTSQNAIIAVLAGVEQLLRGSASETGNTLEQLLSTLDNGFSQTFFSNFDSSKECLALLYTSIQLNVDAEQAVQQESSIVECINLANNMVNALAEVKATLNVN